MQSLHFQFRACFQNINIVQKKHSTSENTCLFTEVTKEQTPRESWRKLASQITNKF